MQFYVPPEQQMREKADFARKGISRGRSVVAMTYADGVLFVADNPSATLYKLSEIYDRVAFAAVGKYSEFEQLRVGGIRIADVRGYQYAREDVTGRSLANAYANALGSAFTDSPKPFEVELLVSEVGESGVEIYHILYDGSITDEDRFVAIGGNADEINTRLRDAYQPSLDLPAALRLATGVLFAPAQPDPAQPAPAQPTPEAGRLEVAGLDRRRNRRKFFRLAEDEIAAALSGAAPRA